MVLAAMNRVSTMGADTRSLCDVSHPALVETRFIASIHDGAFFKIRMISTPRVIPIG